MYSYSHHLRRTEVLKIVERFLDMHFSMVSRYLAQVVVSTQAVVWVAFENLDINPLEASTDSAILTRL